MLSLGCCLLLIIVFAFLLTLSSLFSCLPNVASALSDDRVIRAVNESFIAIAINVTSQGFPVDKLPAMRYVEAIYSSNWRNHFGFANCMVLDSGLREDRERKEKEGREVDRREN